MPQVHIENMEYLRPHESHYRFYVIDTDIDGNILYGSRGESLEIAQRSLKYVENDYMSGDKNEKMALSNLAKERYYEIVEINAMETRRNKKSTARGVAALIARGVSYFTKKTK